MIELILIIAAVLVVVYIFADFISYVVTNVFKMVFNLVKFFVMALIKVFYNN